MMNSTSGEVADQKSIYGVAPVAFVYLMKTTPESCDEVFVDAIKFAEAVQSIPGNHAALFVVSRQLNVLGVLDALRMMFLGSGDNVRVFGINDEKVLTDDAESYAKDKALQYVRRAMNVHYALFAKRNFTERLATEAVVDDLVVAQTQEGRFMKMHDCTVLEI